MTRLAHKRVEERLHVDTRLGGEKLERSLLHDARLGLTAEKKWLHAKYFYDARGSELFERITELSEYYQTRTEADLLESVADDVMARVSPAHLVELGSGSSKKTRILLEALHRAGDEVCYVPLDVDETMLRAAAEALLADFPWLEVHALVGDYADTLTRLPASGRRLVVFLGGTIGNFTPGDDVAFLSELRRHLREGDALLLGTDLVKDPAVLHAAYNDAQGLTAEFNKNMLHVLNRELGADFDPDAFRHQAFYDADKARIEMHLVATRPMSVRVPALDLTVTFAKDETLHTEVSRKFTRQSVAALLGAAGFSLCEWYTPENEYFALSLGEPAAS